MDYQIDPRLLANSKLPAGVDKKTKDLAAIRESSRQFEAMLLNEMLKAMRKSVPEGGLFDKSNATEIFRDMLDTETTKAASKGKGLGIGEAMYKQLEKTVKAKK